MYSYPSHAPFNNGIHLEKVKGFWHPHGKSLELNFQLLPLLNVRYHLGVTVHIVIRDKRQGVLDGTHAVTRGIATLLKI